MPFDLTAALATATSAAVEAGALIRAEYHRAGGPRGHGGHADIDREAEVVIRSRLLSAYPETGYVGEETGHGGRSDADHLWLVDPNDGTSSFTAGWRGSAVSIGLVRAADGLPILGVVYAPVAPDDAADLFTWAEGRPIRRNGREVVRAALVHEIDEQTLILLNHKADARSEEHSQHVHPARFMSVPSIAYRLALVASGDADGAISLSSPTNWDVAGGHALLLGAGGDLMDSNGRPIRYPGGRWYGGDVFGGSKPVARWLAEVDWQSGNRRSRTVSSAAIPLPGRRISDAGLLARAQGCLLGQAAGDALGQLVEFKSAAEIRRKYPDGVRELEDGGSWNTIAGQPTDDTELALALAQSIIASGEWRADAAAAAYKAWLASGPYDVGSTTHAGINGRPNEASESNGSLMRISPLGVHGHAMPADELAELARADSRLTHPNATCRDACACYAVAVAHAVRHGDGPEPAYRAACEWAFRSGATNGVLHALEAAASGPPTDFERHMGHVTIALQNAFHEALHGDSLEESVIRTVGRGGDTDTNGAIAGALLGAIHGREALPLRWRQAVLSCRPIGGSLKPRPREYWPIDLMRQAESLLALGAAG